MTNCIFCKIGKGLIPSTKVFEDEYFFIIEDIAPMAAVHYLAIPKRHYAGLSDMQASDGDMLGHMFSTIGMLEKQLGVSGGYRLVINQGDDGGQTVGHLHVHIMGGQKLPFHDLKELR